MDLGSALAGLGWPVMGAQTVWVRGFAAARLLLAAGEGSQELPRVRGTRAGLNSQAIVAVHTSSSG